MGKCQCEKKKMEQLNDGAVVEVSAHHQLPVTANKWNHSRQAFCSFRQKLPRLGRVVEDLLPHITPCKIRVLWHFYGVLLYCELYEEHHFINLFRSTFFPTLTIHVWVRIEAFFVTIYTFTVERSIEGIKCKSKQMFAKYITLLLYFLCVHLGDFLLLSSQSSRFGCFFLLNAISIANNPVIRILLLLHIFWDQFLWRKCDFCSGSFYHSNE